MNNSFKLFQGNNIDVLKTLDDNSIDSIVTDPPYGLSFMNKKWDYDVPSVEFWKEIYRVLKHGGHVLSFGGTRTYHRMVVNMEDAGFEIRDQIMWLYGSGFPKSHNIGKAIDKIQGNERKIIGTRADFSLDGAKRNSNNHRYIGEFAKEIQHEYGYKQSWDAPVTKGQSEWEGWGTALKPANEPICVARKPLSEKSVAENVLKHGTGGINIDGCRVEGIDPNNAKRLGKDYTTENTNFGSGQVKQKKIASVGGNLQGRFPANVIIDEEAGKILDGQSGISKSNPRTTCDKRTNKNHDYGFKSDAYSPHNDMGGASRFFYCPKASKKDREEINNHPTVKPTDLMRYLCRLITPKNGIILDPYMGSGSTGKGAILEGFNFYGIEMDSSYFEISQKRISKAKKEYDDYQKQLILL